MERERGITIFSKNASVVWQDTAVEGASTSTRQAKINIIDTPGHADFGGEVERVLKMADGALLLVDAKEGPMPQTRFVLKKALQMGLKILVVINKIDKPDARVDYVLNHTFDLFVELGASDEATDFPVIYASAKHGKAGLEPDLAKMTDISPVFNSILEHVPAPSGDANRPLQVLITTISSDQFKGRIATGRVYNGVLKAGQEVMHINRDGLQKKYRLTSIMAFEGLERVDAQEVLAGDLVAISGVPDINIGETIADVNEPVALPLLAIDEPTVKMTFSVNNSPLAGREGKLVTSRQIRDRLFKELENDMALRVEDVDPKEWVVSGRGELHLAILIERMRREGHEFQVSRPHVITKVIGGKIHVPYERVYIEVPEDFSGVVMQKMGERGGLIQDMRQDGNITHLEFVIPTQGFLGYRSEFLIDTRGLGIMNTIFEDFKPDTGVEIERKQGSLVAHESGTTNLYGLLNVQDRGTLFLGPAVEVYKGQVVGQNARPEDIRVNVCKTKQLSNMRSKGDGTAEHFKTPRIMDLEDALEYISDDELVEVTPKSVRIRKRILDEVEERRKKALGLK